MAGTTNQWGFQLTDLDHEGSEVPEVMTHHHTSRVAQDLVEAAGDHAAHKPPLVPRQAHDEVYTNSQREGGQEGDIGSQSRDVGVDAVLGTADIECAICVWPERIVFIVIRVRVEVTNCGRGCAGHGR